MTLRLSTLALLIVVAFSALGNLASARNEKIAAANSVTKPCVDGRTAPTVGFWTWPANTEVNIYLRQPDFSASEVAFVQTAVENWDRALIESGASVRFVFRGLTTKTRMAQDEVTIIRSVVSDKNSRQRAILEAHSRQRDQFIDYALILVDPRVKNPATLTNVIAHELGHSLGLMDCYKCEGQSTAMVLLKRGDESNGIEGPTSCDTTKVSAAYAVLRPRNSAPASSLIVAQNKPQKNSTAGLR